MNEKEIMRNFLSIEQQPMPFLKSHHSMIALLLKSARKMFGCNLTTGKYESLEFSTKERFEDGTFYGFQFSGLVNYLIFLEQIGGAFKPKNIPKLEKNGIFKCLKYFSTLSSDETKIDAIVALRNSLAHRFGLATEKNPKKSVPRKFILSIERNSQIVKLPEYEWNGDFSIESDDSSSTTIYIIDLVELIENVYRKLLEEVENDNIEITLADGIQELKARYSITH